MFVAVLLAAALIEPAQAPAPAEVIAQIQIHGNFLTPDDEVIEIADVRIGMPFDASTIEAVTARLGGSGRFVNVEVLKRFASIADLNQVLLVIIVDDGRVHVNWDTGEVTPAGGLTGRRGPRLMFLPILGSEDGYGLTYGVQLALPNPIGPRSRVGVPLSWGGEKKFGVELEKNFDRGPFTRIAGGGRLTRRENPFYEKQDDRRRAWIQAERRFARPLRAGVTAGWQRASFDGANDSFGTIGADLTVDTRLDPFLTPNAVFARAGWERLGLESGAVHRASFEAIGHVGLFGQNVLALRAQREDSSADLPPYLESLLGGMGNLRGFHAGTAVGDTLVAGSAELRVPLTSPLNVGKLGVSAFVDVGTVYDHRERVRGRQFERGVGGSAWITATVFKMEFSVARGLGSGTRVHFGAATTF